MRPSELFAAAVFAAVGFGLAGGAVAADTCDSLRAQIETKIRSAGVEQFTVTIVDAAASAPGKVVGTCDRGASKIVYERGRAGAASASAATPRAAPRSDAILTECKDGTASLGGRCGK